MKCDPVCHVAGAPEKKAAPEAQVEAARQREVAPHVADAHRALAHELEDVGVRRVVAVFRDVVADALHGALLAPRRGAAPASAAALHRCARSRREAAVMHFNAYSRSTTSVGT